MPDDTALTTPATVDPEPAATPGAPPVDSPDSWMASVPTEYAEEKIWAPLKGKPLGDVLKGYAEAQKFIGGSVRIPGPDAPPEERDRFLAKLGRPESPEKYEITPAQGSPWDPKTETGFRKLAHTIGLTQSQVAALTDYYKSDLGNVAAFGDTLKASTTESLKKEWGATYDYRIARAARAAAQVGGDDVLGLLDATGFGNHPVFIKMFDRLGKELAEDGSILEDSQGVTGPSGAQAKVAAIMGDSKSPYWHRDHPDHEKQVQEVYRLNQLAYTQ